MLQQKNAEDQIQDFIWYLIKVQLDVDVADIGARAGRARVRADATATYRGLQTVGLLLLNNLDFYIFLADLSTVRREVLYNTAFSLADVSKQAGKAIEPDKKDQDALKHPNGNRESKPVPSNKDLTDELAKVSEAVVDGTAEVLNETCQSIADHVTGEEGETLVYRLKETVLYL